MLSVVKRGYHYTSEQSHSEFTNGKRRMKTQRVTINGPKGYKEVITSMNGKRRTSKKKLTKKEIECIRRCQFVPGLFKDCERCLKA